MTNVYKQVLNFKSKLDEDVIDEFEEEEELTQVQDNVNYDDYTWEGN
jgi:hypothetical protein